MPQHFRELAQFISSEFMTSSKQLAVEIGSNDGTLLAALKARGIRVLGVDPAANLAKIANERGVETLASFFNSTTANQIREKRGKARAIIANNVFAHVDDLHDFMKGVALLLEDDGILSIEVPYVGDLNQNVEYDTIYHEHLSYFSVHPILRLFSDFGMRLEGVTRLDVHGGSIRVTARKSQESPTSLPFIDFERRCGLNKVETYEGLSDRIEYQKEYLRHTLAVLKSKGHRIVGYGAPAKSNTLLNVCKIGTETLDYVIDTTPEKIGKFTPGMHIPIYETEKFRRDQPPYSLMLAWNYEKEIIMKEREYKGQFIVPIPSPKILPRNV
jgi:SAM-dependent methyltransferase